MLFNDIELVGGYQDLLQRVYIGIVTVHWESKAIGFMSAFRNRTAPIDVWTCVLFAN
jgi:hypothetical protein